MALTVVDAGVAIGLLDAGDAHHQAALETLRACLQRADELVMPASAYAEMLVGPFRSREQAVVEAEEFLTDVGIRIEPIGRDIARLAARLRATYGARLRLPDALVVATVKVLDADRAITTDRRWPRDLPITVEVV